MKIIPYDPDVNEDEGWSVDWRASPYSALEAVDDALREHGLEVVLFDARDDQHRFFITRLSSPPHPLRSGEGG